MLKKENRLTKKEFDFVFNNGKKEFSKNFMLIKIPKENSLKISTTISKKIYKLAVDRNKSRRIIYKILQENLTKIHHTFWATLIATKPILDFKKEELEKEILDLMKIK